MRGELLEAAKGEELSRKGRPQKFLYHLVSGVLQATITVIGSIHSTLLGKIEAGEWFGR